MAVPFLEPMPSTIDIPSSISENVVEQSSDIRDNTSTGIVKNINSTLLVQHLSIRPSIRYSDIEYYECAYDIKFSKRMLYCSKCVSYTCIGYHSFNRDKYPCCENQTHDFIT